MPESIMSDRKQSKNDKIETMGIVSILVRYSEGRRVRVWAPALSIRREVG